MRLHSTTNEPSECVPFRAIAPVAFRLLMLGALTGFAGCESKGPAEKAGEKIDKGIQNAKDAVDPRGPGEKAGRKLDKAIEP